MILSAMSALNLTKKLTNLEFIMKVLVGADTELFLKRGKKHISAFGEIPGTKSNPFVVPFGAVQVDGMALEFNIDPAKSEAEFVHNTSSVLEKLQSMLPNDQLIIEPTYKFSKATMDEQPAVATEVGCDPDFNAYTGEANPMPKPLKCSRTAGGHIHVGWCTGVDPTHPEHVKACIMLVKQLDFYLGLASFVFDEDTARRKVYGQAGSFRPKSYGVEYRSLSNAWAKDTKYTSWVYRATVKACEDLANGVCLHNKYGDFAKDIINMASESNMDLVKRKASLICKMTGIGEP